MNFYLDYHGSIFTSAQNKIKQIKILYDIAFFFKFLFRLEDGIQALEKEANIDFCRSMNRIIFDKIIEQDNSTFAFVSVPAPEIKPVPHKGNTYFC